MQHPEEETAEEFSKRLMGTISGGFVTPSIALGYELGLFDKMAEFTESKSSQEIADSLEYKERLVLNKLLVRNNMETIHETVVCVIFVFLLGS